MRQGDRKGQGMLEYIIIVGAVMVVVIAFATARMRPTTRDMLDRIGNQINVAGTKIDSIVP
jgi:hypothetical protein